MQLNRSRLMSLPVVLLLLGCCPLAAQRTSGTKAFAIEALGGVAGSGAGVALGTVAFRPGSCDGEDVACILEKLGSIGLVTSLTTPVGTWTAGRAADTEPHVVGAVLGGLIGAAAGVGAIRLVDEAGGRIEGVPAVLLYSVTQGVSSALGSRLLRAVRNGP